MTIFSVKTFGRFALFGLVLLGLTLVLVACGNDATPGPAQPTATPQPTVPPSPTPFTAASYTGTWQGVVVFTSFGSHQLVVVISDLKYDGVVGASDYPTLKCTYSLRMSDVKPGKYTLKEKLEHAEQGAGCNDNGTVNMRLVPDGTLVWEWFYADGKPGAYATLTRKNDYLFQPTRGPYGF